MKKCVFMKTLNSDGKTQVGVKFFMDIWKEEDHYTIILPFADRPEVPYEVGVWRKSFPKKNVRKVLRFCSLLESDLDVS